MLVKVIQKQPPVVLCKKRCVLRNFAKFTGKHLCQSFFFNEVAGHCLETSKNTFFTEHLWETASGDFPLKVNINCTFLSFLFVFIFVYRLRQKKNNLNLIFSYDGNFQHDELPSLLYVLQEINYLICVVSPNLLNLCTWAYTNLISRAVVWRCSVKRCS